MMKAIVWDGEAYPAGLAYRDWDVPIPAPGWVLVNTRAAGICGSDLHLIRGELRHVIPDRNLPAILGHENAGVVIEAGDGTVGVVPGQRVAVEPLHGCIEFGGSCPMCRVGKYQLCQCGLTAVGNPVARMLPGGFGEYSAVHATRLFPLPQQVSFDEAALLDVLAVCVHAVHIGQPALGQTAAVLGCGVIGLDLIQCLRAQGMTDVIAIARHEFQAQVAQRSGASEVVLLQDGLDPVDEVMRLTAGRGVDLAYECIGGDSDGVDQSLGMCATGGSVVMLGCAVGRRPINLEMLLTKEARILASNSYSTWEGKREFQTALDLLAAGKVDHQFLITHKFAPGEYRQAFDVALNKSRHRAIKTLFVRDCE